MGEFTLYLGKSILAVVLAMAVCPVMAAPTVKNLGNATSSGTYGNIRDRTQTTPTTVKRASSLRVTGATTRPTVKVSGVVNSATNTSDTTNSVTSARAPGMHGNLLKGFNSKLSSSSTSQAQNSTIKVSDLEQRMDSLEAELATKQDKVTSGDVVESGTGPIVTSVTANNGTVVVEKTEISIPVGSVTSDTRAAIWIE